MQAHFFTFFIGNIFSFYIYWTKFILRFLSKKGVDKLAAVCYDQT